MIQSFDSIAPRIGKNCFVAPDADVIGDVGIGEESSVWFHAVIRGDVHSIRIGKRTNVQDLSVIHVSNRDGPVPNPTVIGDEVTIGHRAVVHACTVGNRCLIGIGAVVLDGAVIEDECVIGAGSVVTPGTRISGGHLAFGIPARVVRPLNEAEKQLLVFSADNYCRLARKYLELSLRGSASDQSNPVGPSGLLRQGSQ